jgi:endogenous inhibitor of DNA gyrase (YacG/DUF329 family)
LDPLLCPICKKEVAKDAAAFPFCCERCRLIDLGNWLDGKYTLSDDSDEPKDHEN